MEREEQARYEPSRQGSFESIYEGLPIKHATIRIVNLHGGTGDEPLACDLELTTLEEAQNTYEALSYCWGAEEESASMKCNDLEIPLRPNVFAALQRLRPSDGKRRLWVDCLSINQANVTERGEQVSVMVDIFERAKRVVVWLGEENDESDDVMDFISDLDPAPAMQHFRSWRNPNAVRPSRVNILEARGPEWSKQINALLTRPWFRRVWIQQEAACGTDVIVMCGSKTVDWHRLFAFSWMLTHGSSFTSEAARRWADIRRGSAQPTRMIRKIQLYRDRRNRPSLLFVLHSARSCEATDPRDRIYAVQHLARHGPDSTVLLEPNYEIELTQMCLDFAKVYIERRGIAIIPYAGRTSQADPSLPSWVPDWGCRRSNRLMGFPDWNAGGHNQAKARVEQDNNTMVLVARALVIDTLTGLGGVLDTEDPEILQRLRCFRHIESKAYSMIEPEMAYHTGETQEHAYLRTLVADNPQDRSLWGQTARPRFRQEYKHWQQWLHEDDTEVVQSHANRPLYDVTIEKTGTFRYRQFASTDREYMCLVPKEARAGDQVCILQGLDRPMVIRQQGPYQEFVGECYVHGVMQGQARTQAGWKEVEFA